MASRKIRVGLLFGGRSAEHAVSLQSAKNVYDAIDKDAYEVVLIGIDQSGRWLLPDASQFLINAHDPALIALNKTDERPVVIAPQSGGELTVLAEGDIAPAGVDVIFPILHGPYGEDGTVQGLLKLAGVPCVGAGVLGSAVGMDKDVMKRLLRDAGVPIARFVTLRRAADADFDALVAELGLPLFVKPANLGSSVGVSKATDRESFDRALALAFEYDTKVLVEEFVKGREVECGVLGNDTPIASAVGEIVPHHDFYSYEAKYIDEKGAELKIPADLPAAVADQVRALAIKTFLVLECAGLARVDCFLKEDGTLLVNEINTIPGFTKISMYPRLFAESGVAYSALIDRLIRLALERFDKERHLKNVRV